jgi:hypothetical protein
MPIQIGLSTTSYQETITYSIRCSFISNLCSHDTLRFVVAISPQTRCECIGNAPQQVVAPAVFWSNGDRG